MNVNLQNNQESCQGLDNAIHTPQNKPQSMNREGNESEVSQPPALGSFSSTQQHHNDQDTQSLIPPAEQRATRNNPDIQASEIRQPPQEQQVHSTSISNNVQRNDADYHMKELLLLLSPEERTPVFNAWIAARIRTIEKAKRAQSMQREGEAEAEAEAEGNRNGNRKGEEMQVKNIKLQKTSKNLQENGMSTFFCLFTSIILLPQFHIDSFLLMFLHISNNNIIKHAHQYLN